MQLVNVLLGLKYKPALLLCIEYQRVGFEFRALKFAIKWTVLVGSLRGGFRGICVNTTSDTRESKLTLSLQKLNCQLWPGILIYQVLWPGILHSSHLPVLVKVFGYQCYHCEQKFDIQNNLIPCHLPGLVALHTHHQQSAISISGTTVNRSLLPRTIWSINGLVAMHSLHTTSCSWLPSLFHQISARGCPGMHHTLLCLLLTFSSCLTSSTAQNIKTWYISVSPPVGKMSWWGHRSQIRD